MFDRTIDNVISVIRLKKFALNTEYEIIKAVLKKKIIFRFFFHTRNCDAEYLTTFSSQ
jgi:hypothetical protein